MHEALQEKTLETIKQQGLLQDNYYTFSCALSN